ncbi:MAG TPA: glycosyltransferase [Streptosporangiaceae bacterium]|nr:glycosyltransferase [Streptosporangiaceae bacterium]
MTYQSGSQSAPWLQIVVPARNEQARLPAGLAQLCAKAETLPAGVEVLVVDSASTDRTAQIVLDWPAGEVSVRLLRCDRPGKGAAVRAGLLATCAPFVGFCDADMAADLSALDYALWQLQAGRQVVVGSRAHAASVVEVRHSPVRKAGAAVFRAAAQLVAAGPRDTQCGFKFFAGPVARRAAADLTATGFAFDVELIARCRQLGADMVEIPVRWRDIPGSTFSVWRHSLAAFAEIAGIWLALRLESSWTDGDADPGPAAPSPAGAVLPASVSTSVSAP